MFTDIFMYFPAAKKTQEMSNSMFCKQNYTPVDWQIDTSALAQQRVYLLPRQKPVTEYTIAILT